MVKRTHGMRRSVAAVFGKYNPLRVIMPFILLSQLLFFHPLSHFFEITYLWLFPLLVFFLSFNVDTLLLFLHSLVGHGEQKGTNVCCQLAILRGQSQMSGLKKFHNVDC